METKAVKPTQALRACNSSSGMLYKGIYKHLPGRCQSRNLLCLLKPAFSKHDYSSLLTGQRTVGWCCRSSLSLRQCSAPFLPPPHCPILPKDGCLLPSLPQAPALPCAPQEPVNPTGSAGKHSLLASPVKTDFRAWKTGAAEA